MRTSSYFSSRRLLQPGGLLRDSIRGSPTGPRIANFCSVARAHIIGSPDYLWSHSNLNCRCEIGRGWQSSNYDSPLDRKGSGADIHGVAYGGVLVSTWKRRQRRHAEDGSLASLIIGPKN